MLRLWYLLLRNCLGPICLGRIERSDDDRDWRSPPDEDLLDMRPVLVATVEKGRHFSRVFFRHVADLHTVRQSNLHRTAAVGVPSITDEVRYPARPSESLDDLRSALVTHPGNHEVPGPHG